MSNNRIAEIHFYLDEPTDQDKEILQQFIKPGRKFASCKLGGQLNDVGLLLPDALVAASLDEERLNVFLTICFARWIKLHNVTPERLAQLYRIAQSAPEIDATLVKMAKKS